MVRAATNPPISLTLFDARNQDQGRFRYDGRQRNLALRQPYPAQAAALRTGHTRQDLPERAIGDHTETTVLIRQRQPRPCPR